MLSPGMQEALRKGELVLERPCPTCVERYAVPMTDGLTLTCFSCYGEYARYASLSSIVVLYRQSDTMTLWGIPYKMRPGQSPRDLLRGDEERREHAAYSTRHGLPCLAKSSQADWIYLGGCGWYGSMSSERIAEVKAFLERHKDSVPQNPEEHSDISEG